MRKMSLLAISILIIGVAMVLVGFSRDKHEGILSRKITNVDGSYYFVVKDSKTDTGDSNISYNAAKKIYGFRYTGKAFQEALSRLTADKDVSVTKITVALSNKNPKTPIGFFVSVK